MPDGFSFRVSYGDSDQTFTHSGSTGDPDSFREACEAVMAVAPGKDEAEIRQLLTDELRSRNITVLVPGVVPDEIAVQPWTIDNLAAAIAAGNATITVGGPGEYLDPPPEQPGLVGSLIWKVVGRVFARQLREFSMATLAATPMARQLWTDPQDSAVYIPEPGQEPAPAKVITDPDVTGHTLWPAEPPLERQPGMAWPTKGDFFSTARLKEENGVVVVYASRDRIGTLSAADAERYLPHLQAAQLHDQWVPALVTGRIKGRRLLRASVRIGRPSDPRLLGKKASQGTTIADCVQLYPR
jgi:hypothetical protein